MSGTCYYVWLRRFDTGWVEITLQSPHGDCWVLRRYENTVDGKEAARLNAKEIAFAIGCPFLDRV